MEFAKKRNISADIVYLISDVHKGNKKLKGGLEIETEQVQNYIKKSTFVELKRENICNDELRNLPPVQIKTENLKTELAKY